MSLTDAHAFASSLATSLMAVIVISKAGDGTHSTTPATQCIVKQTMSSEGCQVTFSVVGAVAIGATALTRLAAMATPGSTGQNLVRG